jgi:hypothetical protein
VSPRFQQRIVVEFTAWASAEGIVPGDTAGRQWRERITFLLQGRAAYLDRPDPTRWRSGDVHDLFMTYVVPRQVDAWGLAEHGLDTVRDYLRFLDATDRLHPPNASSPRSWPMGSPSTPNRPCSTPGRSGSVPATRRVAVRCWVS